MILLVLSQNNLNKDAKNPENRGNIMINLNQIFITKENRF